jgi:nicotinate-nucleotide adenylyltransferase
MRVGVFGGSFDPVHTGHLMLAEAALVRAGLDRVLFMPTYIQPFKRNVRTSSADDRIRMLALAIRGNPRFGISTVETDRDEVSYTILSLRALKEELAPEGVPVFIVGTDMFLMIEQWYSAAELLREFDLVVGVRPGGRQGEAEGQAARLRKKYGTRIDLIDNPPVEVSSTEIRAKIAAGESIRSLVPEEVRRFLLVREREGERRFAHTKRVIDLAVRMARRFGADEEKARLAALLHDLAKDPAGGAENNIRHGALAAEIARREFRVADADVLNAIRYHTTGRAGMSKLELIIFLADTVEPGRTYDSIDRLRGMCLEDLEKGALTVLIELKAYLQKNGFEAAADTEAAIAELREKAGLREKQEGK